MKKRIMNSLIGAVSFFISGFILSKYVAGFKTTIPSLSFGCLFFFIFWFILGKPKRIK